MGDSSTVTEEPVIARPPDVVTEDGPSGEQPADHADHPSSGELDALDDGPGDEGTANQPDPNATEDDDESDSGDDKPPRHGSKAWQKSVDRLTRQRAEERRAREAAERQAAEERGRRLALEELLRKQGTLPDDQAQGEETSTPAEPQPEDFDSVEEYAKAYSAWERQAEVQKPNGQAEPPQGSWAPSDQSLEIRTKALEAARAEFDDIEERLDRVGPSVSLPMLKAVEFDEDGARILAHLADHPDDLKRIASLTDEAQVSKALQRFAGKVLSEASSTKPPAQPDTDDGDLEEVTPRANRQPAVARVSRAQPVGTVLHGGRVKSEPDLEAMDFDDFDQYMTERERRRR